LNTRERFIATMNFEPVDHIPLIEWGYWADTWPTWIAQGAPLINKGDLGVNDPQSEQKKGGWDPYTRVIGPNLPLRKDAKVDFIIEPGIQRVPLNTFIYPLYEPRIIEDKNDVIISQDERGIIRADKKGQETLFQVVANPVNNWQDWEKVKAERLAIDLKGRLPADWENIKKEFKNRDYPLAIGGHSALCGFYHPLRYLYGPEKLLMGFYDEPELVRAMMNHLCDLQVTLFDQILNEVEVDFCFSCEDLGFKAGPFISPGLFNEYLVPCYNRLIAMLRDHGIKIMFVDNDGQVTQLIPDSLKCGITAMGPFECAAEMDVIKVRQQFPKIQMLGGIDKRKLAAGKKEIDEELNYKVPSLIKNGGYIPTCDHTVPPDVSWENFCYYRKRLTEMALDCGNKK
jgi:hypothetical protein